MMPLVELIACILFVAMVAVGSAIYGGIALLKSLEHCKVIENVDGKEEIRINFILGPFRYVINVPEKREGATS